MAKNVARTHSSARALTTALVVGQGPSSKVRTTSLSRRKSCCLKCSKPNPGPPLVSISTTRVTPSAWGFLQIGFEGPAILAGLGFVIAAEFTGGGKATGAVGAVCGSVDGSGEGVVPVTRSVSGTFAGNATVAGSWTACDRPMV